MKSILNSPNSSSILEQAVANVIKATAAEETALSNILNFESDIIQKAKMDSVNLDEFVSINELINSILENITKVQMRTHMNLQFVEELLQKMENFGENDTIGE